MGRGVKGALALLLALPRLLGADISPVAEMETRGYLAAVKISDRIGGADYLAVLFQSKTGAGGDVKIYATLKGKPYMIYTHTSVSDTPRLDESLTRKRFPDFFKDGSRALVYRMVNPALGRSTLYVLRFQGGRFRRVGAFPEGKLRDLDGDGRFKVITQSAPLGRLLTISCPRFETTVTSALKTDVQAWDGGRFVSTASRHPGFFENRIAEGEAALAALAPRKADRAGDYASLALTLYYDHAAAGHARRGWERLSELLDPKISLPGAADCFNRIKADLRSRLLIPADW